MSSAYSENRQKIALDKIKSLLGSPEGEFGPTLFIEHHLEEIEESYWLSTYKSARPDPMKILDALVLVGSWSSEDDENIDTYDFSLPGDVTNYLLSVRFNDNGQVEEVSMES